jgi:hypothetical protein
MERAQPEISMHRFSLLFASLVVIFTTQCAPHSPSIPLTSSDFDLGPLVGQWRGVYSSAATGRTGTIAFTLRAGEGAASGNIVMVPRPDSLLTPEERVSLDSVSSERSVLKIHFVRKEGNNVGGMLDPYRDPDCNCPVRTTFEGAFVDARTIQGTYTTVPSVPGRSVTTGKWRVRRVKRL